MLIRGWQENWEERKHEKQKATHGKKNKKNKKNPTVLVRVTNKAFIEELTQNFKTLTSNPTIT